MPRKQLNIGLSLAQYEAVQKASEEEGITVTEYCRDAILSRAMPEPELADVSSIPAWLIHFLIFVTRGKPRAA